MVKPMKYQPLFLRVLRGFMQVFLAVIMCGVLMLMTLALAASKVFCIVIGICMLFIYYGLLFNYSYRYGKMDRDHERLHKKPHDRFMPYKMAFIVPCFQYLSWILLLISRFVEIKPACILFSLTNFQFFPFAYVLGFMANTDTVPPAVLPLSLIQLLVGSAVIVVTYMIYYKDIDIKSKLIYKNKSE